MNGVATSAVTIQTLSKSLPSVPEWLGEVALVVGHIKQQGVLSAVCRCILPGGASGITGRGI